MVAKCCRPVRRGNSWSPLTTCLCIVVAAACSRAASAANKHDADATAKRLVDEAQQAAHSGNNARRYALLREAVRVSPDFSLARWQLGQIEADDKWLSVEEAQRRAAANPKYAQYRELRTEYGDSAQGQAALARWCRKNGLRDEARFHWSSVISVDPKNEEAMRALGMRRVDGRLLTKAQIAEAKKSERESRRAWQKWSTRVANWERAIAGSGSISAKEALDDIRRVDDCDAIEAFESVTLDGDVSETERTERRRKVSLTFVAALANMPDQRATVSLVRHAVMSPLSDVRSEAAERLRYRSPHDYVPLLLSALMPEFESWFQVTTDRSGGVHYRHTLYREGSQAKWSVNLARSSIQQDVRGHTFLRTRDGLVDTGRHRESDAEVAGKMASVAKRSAERFGSEAAVIEQQVAYENDAIAAKNERITRVLAATTGEGFANDPKAWADWWQKYNEYYSDGERPSYDQNYVDNRYYYHRMPEVYPPPMSCFAKGTLVWTKTGERPIETLELGDLVLAQNVDAGELAYKPVVGRTVRPPSPILKLRIGDEQLLTTRGHPFWVAGVGWRMAKELGDAAILYGVTGAARIDAVESAGDAEAYNLVVADFNTYFVGNTGVLVHDNTPRSPTRATVPGLVAK